MNRALPVDQPEIARSLALLIIPPLQPKQDRVALEAIMQGLVLDKRHPVALELAGTAERRSFIVRATTQTALDHVEALLRSQYPQMEVRPLRDYEDPFRLEAHEEVSATELQAGGAVYLPLRNWQRNPQEQEEIDPILGLLAALSKLPPHTRAVAQISLVPAATNWSRKSLRKSVEHPLEPERVGRQRDAMVAKINKEAYSTPVIVTLGLLFGLFFLVRPWMPAWMGPALLEIATGRNPHLMPSQVMVLVGCALGLLVAGVLLALVLGWIHSILNPVPIYDPRMVSEKTSRMAYQTRLRLYAIGPRLPAGATSIPEMSQQRQRASWDQLRMERLQAEERDGVLLRMAAVYRQFNQANGAYFISRPIGPKQARRLLSRGQGWKQGWSQGLKNSKHMVGVDALAALWHLPQASVLPELALLEHRRARTLLIPPEVVSQGAGRTPIGYSEHGGYKLPFALTPQFFTLHTLITGKSGEGKSTCMEHIAREAMTLGGLILIDPHGDLCDHVLNVVPATRAEDVVLVDLSDKNAVVGINPLDVTLGRGRDKAISDLLKTLAHIWVSSWGPRMENAFEMSLRTLFEANKVMVAEDAQNGPGQQYTLLDVLPILTNENFCHAILQQIEDDYLHRWWREYYEPLSLMQQRDIINPVVTKVAKFESMLARRIIGQSRATLNFSQLIAERKIILIKLAKGVVGNDVAALLGATLLGLLQITLEEQGAKAELERTRFPIILDEFQALAGVDYGALAELRKYGATFFLATQSLEYLQKLDPLLLPTVLANVKQLMIFHVSMQDAQTLYGELGVEAEDILNLDMHTCYVKLAIANRRQPTFSVHVVPPIAGDLELTESIRARCRVRYTCSVDEVDGKLREAMIRGIRMAPASRGKTRPAPMPSTRHEAPKAVKEAPVTIESAPILLPAASTPLPSSEPVGEAVTVEGGTKKRKNRGRRSRQRGEKYRQEHQSEFAPIALDEMDGGEDSDDFNEHELVEIHTLHESKEDDGRQK